MEAARPRLLLITSEWPVVKPKEPRRNAVKRHAEALQAAGMSVEVFTFAGRNVYNYIAAWTRLRPRLHPRRYDLVHAQGTRNVLLALPKRVPLIVTIGKQDVIALLLARYADAVIVGSGDMRGRLRVRAPVHVIPADLDEDAFAARLVAVYRSVAPECFSAS